MRQLTPRLLFHQSQQRLLLHLIPSVTAVFLLGPQTPVVWALSSHQFRLRCQYPPARWPVAALHPLRLRLPQLRSSAAAHLPRPHPLLPLPLLRLSAAARLLKPHLLLHLPQLQSSQLQAWKRTHTITCQEATITLPPNPWHLHPAQYPSLPLLLRPAYPPLQLCRLPLQPRHLSSAAPLLLRQPRAHRQHLSNQTPVAKPVVSSTAVPTPPPLSPTQMPTSQPAAAPWVGAGTGTPPPHRHLATQPEPSTSNSSPCS